MSDELPTCDCGDHARPIEGDFHSSRCAITRYLLEVRDASDPLWSVTIPEHDTYMLASKQNTMWPTRLLAEGAMHRLLTYTNTPVLLWRDDVVVDMKSVECPINAAWRQNHGRTVVFNSSGVSIQ